MTAPQPAPAYRTFPYPYAQRQAVDRPELMSRQHTIHGLVDVDAIEPREFVCLTISVNHDVVNGAPPARFIGRLRDSIETGSLLPGSDSRPS
jgi:pyruvate/2-oxoglutarate dehydrogenase complex dihydrolipoamide acyltransferase (E2) component